MSTQRSLVAGVDSSTQNCKVVICDSQTGEVIRSGRANHPQGTEVDPHEWWTALELAIERAGGLEDVAAISIAAQQHGMIALDAEGRVIRPALLWNDTRSAAAAEALVGEVGAEEYVRRSGSLPVASFTVSKLRWLRDHEPENAARVAAVALPHDWLSWRLRGYGPDMPLGSQLERLATDRSDASGTGYWDPNLGEYDRDLLVRALGKDIILPVVLGPSEVAGTVNSGVARRDDIRVACGAGDNAAAALGLRLAPNETVISIGTSGTVFAVTERHTLDVSGAVTGFADASGRYLPLVATLNAARVLDSISGLLGVDHDQFAELALAAPAGSEGLVLQPYFEGERTPNLPNATATLFGMTLRSSTRNNLARAAIEGMLAGLAAGLSTLAAQGFVTSSIRLIGGAAQNPAVQRIAAQVFEQRVSVPHPGEYVAMGAALQASFALDGELPEWPSPPQVTIESDYRPEILAQYEARF
ncbi:xylulokinase [Lysinibacter sp. HNR]|uniref:xylulokinase n=1 Tax=Lysinibacter sp. HNR TaxID=3031408 RepID=UPI002434EEEA|nr:xylulokinase [Lysinibacter sp. HNR]WGD37240.1 xylulokinase [Lysinibacter sp. HNR]